MTLTSDGLDNGCLSRGDFVLRKILNALGLHRKCEKCSSIQGVKRVYISSINGNGHYSYLCEKCALLEKDKRY